MGTTSRTRTSRTTGTTASRGRAEQLAAALADTDAQARTARLEARLAQASRVDGENRELRARLAALQSRLDLVERLDNLTPTPPTWTRPKERKGALHRAIPCLLVSDTHFDEVVRPQEVEGANAYNRRIAEQRLRRVFTGTVKLLRDYYTGLTYDGAILLLGGDILSGFIHEELVQSNEDTVLGSLDYWSEQIIALVEGLSEYFGGKLHVYGVVGNHGRMTRKPRHKFNVRDNLDWLLYRMVARATRGRATWTIPESREVPLEVYSTRYRFTHGDQFRGGSGIAGMMSPLMLGKHRRAIREMALGKPGFQWLVLGHRHTYFNGLGIIQNGSLKGFDEYSYDEGYPPDVDAIQALWMTTPEYGAAFSSPIFCTDRASERWEDVA